MVFLSDGVGFLFFESPFAEADEIVLEFPEHGVGVVTVSPLPQQDGVIWRFDEDRVQVHKARCKVTVSTEGFIGLEITKSASEDLSFLGQLPEGSISSLTLVNATVGKKQVSQISETVALKQLSFSNCQFESDSFEGVNPLRELMWLSIYAVRSEKAFNRIAMMKWIAGSPKLQSLHCSPALTADDLEALQNHVALESISVTVGRDSDKMLVPLRHLSQLKSLVVFFTSEASADASNGLRELTGLEELRWINGSTDGETLREIAAKNPLKKLMLANVKAGDGLGEALKSFQHLTELEILPFEDQPLPDIVQHLSQMPKLTAWPRLRSINGIDLDHILASKHIESLSIQFIQKDVSLDHLQKIAGLQRLKRLELENIDITDAWLSRLGGLPELEYLYLFGTGVTGKGILPQNFPKLQRLDIWSGDFDDSVVRLDLSSLSSAHNLQQLSIGGRRFDTPQIATIRDCKSLRRLRLWDGGMTDDAIVPLLSEMPNLVELTLADNCVITDAGTQTLKKSPSLQRLYVGGFLSEEGCRALASIPTLRRLNVSSSELSPDCRDSIRDEFHVPDLRIGSYRGDMVLSETGEVITPVQQKVLITGKDGFKRRIDKENPKFRIALDKLEGSPAPMIFEPNGNQKNLLADLKGKVVLIDFWGTWCGPCRRSFPQLKDLYSKYHDQGFEIIGVHTATGAENLDEFVTTKDIRWRNIVDSAGHLEDSFRVLHYPSIYLVDRKGILRVALAYPEEGLEEAIEVLLKESAA